MLPGIGQIRDLFKVIPDFFNLDGTFGITNAHAVPGYDSAVIITFHHFNCWLSNAECPFKMNADNQVPLFFRIC